MKRLLLAVAALFTLVALAGAVGLPDLAGAQDAPRRRHDHRDRRRLGRGRAERGPDVLRRRDARARPRRPPSRRTRTRCAGSSTRFARRGGREIATQWVSVYPVTNDTGAVDGYAASNSVSATSDVDDAAALIDAAAEAGANQISGPGLSSSNAEALYRQALGKAVAEARARAEVLAKAAGRSLGEITDIVEASAAMPYYAERMRRRTRRRRRSSPASRRRARPSASRSPSGSRAVEGGQARGV